MTRISFEKMKSEVKRAFMSAGMSEQDADVCAQIHTETSCDGVYSHGLNRVARFVDYVEKGWVDVHATPSLINSLGAIEVYNGNRGPGILNALFATDKAMEIAKKHGVGIVTLKNTTHWMRGGTYGLKAAEQGFIGISWTNTESCMPAWGAKDTRIGNNPFVMAVPRSKGPIVLDMAMSQYSYGKLQTTRLNDDLLPFPGGFDENGELTREPAPIEETRRILPMGYWKGAGFSILLDAVAAIMSGGNSTGEIDKIDAGSCGGCSQVFIAMDPSQINGEDYTDKIADNIVGYLRESEPDKEGGEVSYPGENSRKRRQENLKNGIPVDDDIWNEILSL
ncbi:3-dehydro-L-gulonate 2-dehydrogenase [Virgibacillus profundi]|uniref:3-dehydro-L-gulonate 2-dehydrogenase n=1 Tax=Virgibacillus profundi TaxID=2024555 RepID=A0A2A2IAG6_9BACI|nr:3-dehydro-L-gulonate 2-dehydrogenase [Virgibacillus profundi]PAV28326.1 3-dehydro-L-gulonate 2-dehydrogenase [Virgibacillus profundi]PXY52312.1 3-dehydro-L-gulonate 2-dehydrogenase [Virgibacillus profundi]